jgi:thiol-disulfide isomerase/thioredoxin
MENDMSNTSRGLVLMLSAAFAVLAPVAPASAAAPSAAAGSEGSNASAKSGVQAQAPKAKPAAWLGVAIADVPGAELPAAYAPVTKEGAVRVQQVFKGTSADQAGLLEGDVILAVNKTDLAGRKTLLDTIHSKTVGDLVELRVGRNGKAFLQKMALSPRPEDMRAITQMLVGSPAPALDGKYYSGDAGTLAQNKGKVVIVDFWATWCGPCRATMPALDALYRKYKDKGLEIIGVSSESLEELKAFQAAGKQAYPMFNDVSQLTTRQYQSYAYPTLVVIDRKGIIQRIEVGAHPMAAIEKWILEYL